MSAWCGRFGAGPKPEPLTGSWEGPQTAPRLCMIGIWYYVLSGKGLISNIYKKLTLHSTKERNNPIRKQGKGPGYTFLPGGHMDGQ